MEKKYLQAIMKKGTDGVITFIASDETLDRQGDVIKIDSWDLKNFKKNPVLLVDHNYKVENIVGSAMSIGIDSKMKALTFVPSFHEITQLSKDVKQMVESGDLNTVSVGFMSVFPKKSGDVIKNELLEISFVAVPANPEALAIRTLSFEEEISVKNFVDEVKEGRTLSKKTRTALVDAVGAMAKAVEVVNDLISKADAEDEGEVKELIETIDELKEKITAGGESFNIDAKLLEILVDDSEKLKTLTDGDGIKVDEDAGLEKGKAFLKEIAHVVNGALHELNKGEKKI